MPHRRCKTHFANGEKWQSSSRRNNTSHTCVTDVLQRRRQRRSSATLIEDIIHKFITASTKSKSMEPSQAGIPTRCANFEALQWPSQWTSMLQNQQRQLPSNFRHQQKESHHIKLRRLLRQVPYLRKLLRQACQKRCPLPAVTQALPRRRL